nr:cyclin-dependent kinase 6 [Quercus suber]POE94772.1 cyclin-dependent kinase 6 [Quercus suber]
MAIVVVPALNLSRWSRATLAKSSLMLCDGKLAGRTQEDVLSTYYIVTFFPLLAKAFLISVPETYRADMIEVEVGRVNDDDDCGQWLCLSTTYCGTWILERVCRRALDPRQRMIFTQAVPRPRSLEGASRIVPIRSFLDRVCSNSTPAPLFDEVDKRNELMMITFSRYLCLRDRIISTLNPKDYLRAAPGRSCRAAHLSSNETEKYVLKEIPQDFGIRESIYHRVGSHPHVRPLVDTIPARRTFVFHYLDENLLGFAQRDLSTSLIKQILKCALQGLAALHQQNVVHNGEESPFQDVKTPRLMPVQLTDLEDSVHLPPGRAVLGAQVGNWMWRSPEAHAQGPVEKPSDMFSFGIVVDGEEKLAIVLERQMSYFADEDGLNGLLRSLGVESPWHEIFQVIKSGFGENQPRKPFSLWESEKLDEDFKNLVGALTNFDPAKRLTAPQALAHRWFENV